MTDHEEFLAWVRTSLYEAELSLHNGDAAPRRALWSRNEPVSILGARWSGPPALPRSTDVWRCSAHGTLAGDPAGLERLGQEDPLRSS